jgi:hypothetical protein
MTREICGAQFVKRCRRGELAAGMLGTKSLTYRIVALE